MTEILKKPVEFSIDTFNTDDVKENENNEPKKEEAHEGLSREDFKRKMKEAAAGEDALVEYIEKNGLDAAFNELDANRDGTIQANEVSEALGNGTSNPNFSITELIKALINKISSPTPQEPETKPENQTENVVPPATENVVPMGNVAPTGGGGGSGRVGGGGGSGGGSVNQNNTQKPETVKELEEKKQKMIQDYDGQVTAKNKEVENLIKQDENISQALKQELEVANQNLEAAIGALQQTESEISGVQTSLHDKECQIAGKEAELGSLKTDTDDEEVNTKNKQRKSELEKEIGQLKDEQNKLKEQLGELEKQKATQLDQQAQAEVAVQEVMNKIMEAASSETKAAIEKIKVEVEQIKAEKTTEIQKIDQQIADAKTKEVDNSKNMGSLAGGDAGALAALMIERGNDPELIDHYENRFKGAYCGSYLRGILKYSLNKLGVDVPKNVRYLGRIDPRKMSAAQKEEWVKTKLRPGMVFEYTYTNRDGSTGWHTGMIAKVYPDGSWDTLEGNTRVNGQRGKVGSHRRDINYKNIYGIYDPNLAVEQAGIAV